MIAAVQTVDGVYEIDLDADEIVRSEAGATLPSRTPTQTGLPLVVDAARSGSTVVAVVNRRPPVVVSHDAGRTWKEVGGGLPAGAAVAIAEEHPDVIVYAARNRLYVSRDGGLFWHALTPELPRIQAVETRR